MHPETHLNPLRGGKEGVREEEGRGRERRKNKEREREERESTRE